MIYFSFILISPIEMIIVNKKSGIKDEARTGTFPFSPSKLDKKFR